MINWGAGWRLLDRKWSAVTSLLMVRGEMHESIQREAEKKTKCSDEENLQEDRAECIRFGEL